MVDNTKKSDRQISIVLNGQEKKYEELEKDKLVYEDLLSEEITATREEEHEEFPWLLSENDSKQSSTKIVDLGERRRDKKRLEEPFWDDGKSEQPPKLPLIKRKQKAKFDFKSLPLGLVGVVMSAIIVGISFGFMMLTIFTGDKTEPTEITGAIQSSQPQDVAPTAIPGQIPMLAVEVVQGGAFSLVAKGHEMAQIMKSNGFSAALSNTADPVYLFIGVGLDREQASVVADQYRANGQEVYLKPYAVSSNSVIEKEEQNEFFATGVDLFEQLTLLSVNGLANGGSLITNESLAQLKTSYDKLISYGDLFAESEAQQPLALAFQDALTSAHEKMLSYANSKDTSDLWQVQQFLLNGLIAYEELIKTY